MALSSDEDDTRNESSLMTTIVTKISSDNLFNVSYFVVQALAVALISLVVVWCNNYLGGFSLSTPEQIFNFHPLFMTIGMLVLNANGTLIYRVTRWWRFQQQKWVHAFVQFCALIVSIAGLWAVFHFHSVKNIPDMYSLHSWLGMTAVCGFALSGLGAFICFLYPGVDPVYRRLVLPFHVFAGTANLVLCAAVAITGITEKAFFSLKKDGETYSDSPPAARVLNMFGIVVVVFTTLVVWLVSKPEFRRRYIPGVNAPQYKLRREQTTE